MPRFSPQRSRPGQTAAAVANDNASSRSLGLRVMVSASLAFAAVLFCTLSYVVLRKEETKLFESQYNVFAVEALRSTEEKLERTRLLSKSAAVLYKHAFPDEEIWPNVAHNGFQEFSEILTEISSLPGQELAIFPIVRPEKLASFEAFAIDWLDSEPSVPAGAATHAFGRGISAIKPAENDSNPAPMRYHDVTGEAFLYQSPNKIVLPVFQFQGAAAMKSGMLFNIHSHPLRGPLIDKMLDCFDEQVKKLGDAAGADLKSSVESDGFTKLTTIADEGMPAGMHRAAAACSSVTELADTSHLKTKDPNPSLDRRNYNPDVETGFFYPVLTANNPTQIVAFAGLKLSWFELLNAIYPGYVSGLDVIIKTDDGTVVSFTIKDGKAQYIGHVDCHQSAFAQYGMHRELSFTSDGNPVISTVAYFISIYPNKEFRDKFYTSMPIYASVVALLVLLVTSVVFFFYDTALKTEMRVKESVLEMKRRFVRFISHEVRTPLNSVKLGLQVLLQDQAHFRKNFLQIFPLSSPGTVLNSTAGKFTQEEEEEEVEEDSGCTTDANAIINGSMSDAAAIQLWITNAIDSMDNFYDLSVDMMCNCDIAVVVLDDLLNYDKVEMGLISLEFGLVRIWDLIQSVECHFCMHAQNKGVSIVVQAESAMLQGYDVASLKCDAIAADRQGPSKESTLPSTARHVDVIEASSSEGSVNNTLDTTSNSSSPLTSVKDEALINALTVLGDVNRLAQTLRNLLSNAIKFTTPGGSIIVNVLWNLHGLEGDEAFDAAIPPEKAEETQQLLNDCLRCGSITITVTDTGAGLSEEQLMNMFGEGVQFNPGKLQAGGGSGLGLFITKSLVEQHGGNIWVASDGLGKGTTFGIELPVYIPTTKQLPPKEASTGQNALLVSISTESSECTGSKKASSERAIKKTPRSRFEYEGPTNTAPTAVIQSKQPTSNSDGKSNRKNPSPNVAAVSNSSRTNIERFNSILLVDDAVSNRKMLGRLLTSRGHVCQEATDGVHALKVYSEHIAQGGHFDTILMDFEMPEMNGPDCTKLLRSKYGCECPIFGVTGNALAQDVEHFLAQGANKVLSKPLNIGALDDAWSDI